MKLREGRGRPRTVAKKAHTSSNPVTGETAWVTEKEDQNEGEKKQLGSPLAICRGGMSQGKERDPVNERS